MATLVSQLLEKKYNISPKYSIEYSPSWLTSTPDRNVLEKYWSLTSQLYSDLLDNKYNLDEQLKLISRSGSQFFDIWFHEPFSLAIEFDESQHFNQFRNRTLKYYNQFVTKIDVELYKIYTDIIKKPGTSGFQKLKRKDPLFPEMFEGEKQDNRIRQRAFRDFLKDILPVAKGFNPTIRIPYHITNKKISDFNQSDIELIKAYLEKRDLLSELIK